MSTDDKINDEELMKLYQQGDYSAFTILYERHKGRIYSYIKSRIKNKAFADEIYQSTFLRLHNTKHLYNPKFKFLSWAYTLTYSELIDNIRKEKRHNILDSVDPLNLVMPTSSNQNELPDNWQDPLSQKEKEALTLRYFDEAEFIEISNQLGVTQTNARKMISRALKKIKSFYQSEIKKV